MNNIIDELDMHMLKINDKEESSFAKEYNDYCSSLKVASASQVSNFNKYLFEVFRLVKEKNQIVYLRGPMSITLKLNTKQLKRVL